MPASLFVRLDARIQVSNKRDHEGTRVFFVYDPSRGN